MPKTFNSETKQIDDTLQIRVNRIDEIENYFVEEIRETEIMSKRLKKHIVAFDYVDQILLVLSATSKSFSSSICCCYWCACWNSK